MLSDHYRYCKSDSIKEEISLIDPKSLKRKSPLTRGKFKKVQRNFNNTENYEAMIEFLINTGNYVSRSELLRAAVRDLLAKEIEMQFNYRKLRRWDNELLSGG